MSVENNIVLEKPNTEIKISNDRNIVNALKLKLGECKEILYSQAEEVSEQYDLLYKIDILKTLLKGSSVNKEQLAIELNNKYREKFNEQIFNKSFDEIKEYNETEISNNIGDSEKEKVAA